jgi:preprotein translocase subunit SecB
MPISQTPLEVESYYVQSLRFDTNDSYVGERPSIGEIAVDFAVFNHPEDALRFQVTMLVGISETEAATNEPYAFHIDLYGFFRFKADTPEETVRKMVFSNAVPILYGIARGCIAQATATSLNGPFMLPPYNFVELVRRKAAAAKKEAEEHNKLAAETGELTAETPDVVQD